jgi:hypothetical protein
MFSFARCALAGLAIVIATACGKPLIVEFEDSGVDASTADGAVADHEVDSADAALDVGEKMDAGGDADGNGPEPCSPGKACGSGICFASGTCGEPKDTSTKCGASYECKSHCCCVFNSTCNIPGGCLGSGCLDP